MNLLEKVKEAGVIGAGGAGFPTHAKLGAKAEYILLNGAECEPLLRVDQQLMEHFPKEVILGLHMAGQQVEAKKAIIGIKNKHKKVIQILEDNINELGLAEEVEVCQLPDIYPAGDEQVLVYECTGRVVPEMGIPIAVGCVVVNTETALNIYNSSMDIPVTMKYVTIAGDVPRPITVKVPVGTPIRDLLAMAGRTDMTGFKMIDGGPMMGPLGDIDGYVNKKTKGLVVLPEEHSLIEKKSATMQSAKIINKSACEQCRLCTDLCPRFLLGHSTVPHKMVRALGYNLDATEEMTVAQTCCQCNLCEYFSCPAGIKPKMANVYYMTELKEKGIRRQVAKDAEFEPKSMRKYRQIPSKRLIAKIDIKQFDTDAPLSDVEGYAPDLLGFSTNSHVGAPAKIIVNVGQHIEEGQKIGEIQEDSLGANVHSSVSGIVESIENGMVFIRRDS
jgi:Na+-translocating ferredoxin:NAD+ oxidoreductase RnfC subunit